MTKALLNVLYMMFIILTWNWGVEGKITVHIIPHSHMDYGWVQTIEEYYYGNVVRIYDTVMKSLRNDKHRTFVISDIAYFKRWYQSQRKSTHELLKVYSKEGRIEFVGGGFVMNDEATTYYRDIIDQIALGLDFIEEELGVRPKIGWSLDAFGHSLTNAIILEKYGYTHAVFNRISFDELIERNRDGNLEFEWVLSNDKTIFITILYLSYNLSEILPLVLDERNKRLRKKDVTQSSQNLIEMLSVARKGLKHDHIMLLFGDDFSFWKGESLYRKMEQIMTYINTHNQFNGEEYELIYSTPSKYYKSIENEGKVFKPNNIFRYKDFLPYASDTNTQWTGFYTSRPYLKGLIKKASNLLQVSTQLLLELSKQSKKTINETSYTAITELRKTVAVMQHHDAITGTCKNRIANDYIKKIINDIDIVQNILTEEVKEYIDAFDNDIKICLVNQYYNKKDCNQLFTSGNMINRTNLILFNPSINDTMLIHIELTNRTNHDEYEYIIYNNRDEVISHDYYCIDSKSFKYSKTCTLYFYYKFEARIPFINLSIQHTNKKAKKPTSFPKDLDKPIISNKGIINKVSYDFRKNSLSFQFNQTIQSPFDLTLLHGYYTGEDGSKSSMYFQDKVNDGSYAFSPSQAYPIIFNTNPNESFIYKGNISTVLIIRFEHSYMLIYIFYAPFLIKVEHIIDPHVSRSKGINFAFIVRSNINNSIETNTSFIRKQSIEYWTDSNGLQMIRRTKNNDDDNMIQEKVARHFYPVTTAVSIRDVNDRNSTNDDPYLSLNQTGRMMTVYNDRSQSSGVWDKGEIILLLNRYSSKDDGFGLKEALYEKESSGEYFKLQHLITIKIDQSNTKEHKDSFFYNYFNNPPLSISGFKTLGRNDKSVLLSDKIINHSNNIRMSYYIVSRNCLKLIVYCYTDPYYNVLKTQGTITFHLNNSQSVIKETFSSNNDSTTLHNKSIINEQCIERKYTIEPNDYETFLLFSSISFN